MDVMAKIVKEELENDDRPVLPVNGDQLALTYHGAMSRYFD